MKDIKVEEPSIIPASLGKRKLTMDPIREIPLTITLREVETTIPAGFQTEWGTVNVNDDKLELNCGAGFGSGWATIHFRGKYYAFSANDIAEQFLKAVED